MSGGFTGFCDLGHAVLGWRCRGWLALIPDGEAIILSGIDLMAGITTAVPALAL